MGIQPVRLRFSEDDLKNPTIRKAAGKAEKKAKTAQKATDKLEKNSIQTASVSRQGKLQFDQKPASPGTPRPVNRKRTVIRSASAAVRSQVHREVRQSEDDNSGVDAANATTQTAETALDTAQRFHYSQKLKAYDQADKLVQHSDRANVNALYQKQRADHPESVSNPLSRQQQKQAIRREYAAAKRNSAASAASSSASKNARKAAEETKTAAEKVGQFVASHRKAIILTLCFATLLLLLSGGFTSCSTLLSGTSQVILATSFTAADEDILGADADYRAMEERLKVLIDKSEEAHPGFDEYHYKIQKIGHNPYRLAAYLTVMFEDYTREEVQPTLQSLFAKQYKLTLEETVQEEKRILTVKLVNMGLIYLFDQADLTPSQRVRYQLLLETSGNRPELFAGDPYAAPGGEYTDYEIPPEALSDERFARMIQEAEKYLGYPYVWGGASPETSFDCSGYVSWVINHCGNGWDYGRLGAEPLYGICSPISPGSAKPGDLIFFERTYDETGITHVGIYVGNGMMIHCGSPISYTSVETSYWREHFYGFGRLPH